LMKVESLLQASHLLVIDFISYPLSQTAHNGPITSHHTQ
jgi:hypothetical protein